jgi:hypothetical protein
LVDLIAIILFQREYRRMIPMIVMLVTGIVLSILVLDFSSATIIYDATIIVIDLYSIAIVYSLYCIFKTESEVGFCAHYQQSIA